MVDVDETALPPLARDRLNAKFDLYASSMTPPAVKKWIEQTLPSEARLWKARAVMQKQARPAASPASQKVSPGWGNVYVYPNPANGQNPVFHVEIGSSEGVEITIADASGREVRRLSVNDPVGQVDGKHVYECPWNISGVAGGIYVYSVRAQEGGRGVSRSGKCVVVK